MANYGEIVDGIKRQDLPHYFRDAPAEVVDAARNVAVAMVITTKDVIEECYPDMDCESQEYRDFVGAVMHIAERMVRP